LLVELSRLSQSFRALERRDGAFEICSRAPVDFARLEAGAVEHYLNS
jgi:hypothetical protein